MNVEQTIALLRSNYTAIYDFWPS